GFYEGCRRGSLWGDCSRVGGSHFGARAPGCSLRPPAIAWSADAMSSPASLRLNDWTEFLADPSCDCASLAGILPPGPSRTMAARGKPRYSALTAMIQVPCAGHSRVIS